MDETTAMEGLDLLVEDAYFPTEERETMVIESEKELRAFFLKVNRTRKPGLPVPEVDFSKEVALIICASAQSGGVMPKLIGHNTSKDVVFEIVMQEGKQKSDIEIVTYPFVVYKMPRGEGEITFRWHE